MKGVGIKCALDIPISNWYMKNRISGTCRNLFFETNYTDENYEGSNVGSFETSAEISASGLLNLVFFLT